MEERVAGRWGATETNDEKQYPSDDLRDDIPRKCIDKRTKEIGPTDEAKDAPPIGIERTAFGAAGSDKEEEKDNPAEGFQNTD